MRVQPDLVRFVTSKGPVGGPGGAIFRNKINMQLNVFALVILCFQLFCPSLCFIPINTGICVSVKRHSNNANANFIRMVLFDKFFGPKKSASASHILMKGKMHNENNE